MWRNFESKGYKITEEGPKPDLPAQNCMICTTARHAWPSRIPAGTATPLVKLQSMSQLNYLVSKQTVIKQQLLLRTIWVSFIFRWLCCTEFNYSCSALCYDSATEVSSFPQQQLSSKPIHKRRIVFPSIKSNKTHQLHWVISNT